MKIDVDFLEGMQLQASFGEYSLVSDQSKEVGGQEEFPEPFSYFLASMVLCAGYFVRKFCDSRGISHQGIKISQSSESIDEGDRFKKKFTIDIELPDNFPSKYRNAVIAAANTCTVKKVIQSAPVFDINLI